MTPPAIIIGAGPGIGAAVAYRFAREGLPVALVARTATTMTPAADRIRPLGVATLCLTADAADEDALAAGLASAVDTLGAPQAVVYNAAVIRADSVEDLNLSDLLATWATNVGGAVIAAKQLVPQMLERGPASYIVTGGMPVPQPSYASLSFGKAGVRTLVQMLAKRYGSEGLHAATVTIAGPVAPGGPFDPDRIAEHYWKLHSQAPQEWQTEILHDPTRSSHAP
jgi:NAD(P)-dependent dehydrogenase (short-subunit alcohol dehydrogenase family)